MSNNALLVRAKELGGQWTVLGADTLRGVTVENPQFSADRNGSRDASFTLRRSPRAIWPDLGAFTDYEIEEGGHLVFEGRVKETPMRDSDDRQIQVNLEGWQAHADDDVYQRTYVETDLSRFGDCRQ